MKIYKYDRKEARKNKYNDDIVFYPLQYVLTPLMLMLVIAVAIWMFVPVCRNSLLYVIIAFVTLLSTAVVLLSNYIKKESWCRTVFVVCKRKLYMIRKIKNFDAGTYLDAICEYESIGYSNLLDVTRLYGAVLHKDSKCTFWCEYDGYDGSVEHLEIPKVYPGLERILDRGYSRIADYDDFCFYV